MIARNKQSKSVPETSDGMKSQMGWMGEMEIGESGKCATRERKKCCAKNMMNSKYYVRDTKQCTRKM